MRYLFHGDRLKVRWWSKGVWGVTAMVRRGEEQGMANGKSLNHYYCGILDTRYKRGKIQYDKWMRLSLVLHRWNLYGRKV